MTQRSTFASVMLDLMQTDDKIVVLLADIGVYAFREHMERWPDRCINTGVSECATVGMGAGLALEGFYPVMSSIDSFLIRRAYEFIRLDFGEQKLPGLFVTVGADDDYASLGPSHKCPEGLTLMGCVPGMSVWEPINKSEVRFMLKLSIQTRQLAYVRLSEKETQRVALAV